MSRYWGGVISAMPKKEDRALVANLLERNNGQRMTYLGVGCAEKRRGLPRAQHQPLLGRNATTHIGVLAFLVADLLKSMSCLFSIPPHPARSNEWRGVAPPPPLRFFRVPRTGFATAAAFVMQ